MLNETFKDTRLGLFDRSSNIDSSVSNMDKTVFETNHEIEPDGPPLGLMSLLHSTKKKNNGDVASK
jgi:hypothetical protein